MGEKLTAVDCETIQRKAGDDGKPKDPYYRLKFSTPYAFGEYKGNEATTFSKACVEAILAKAREVEADYEFQASSNNPKWSPSVTKVTVGGNVIYDSASERRSGGGNRGNRGPGDFESSLERRYRQEGIMAQNVMGHCVALVSRAADFDGGPTSIEQLAEAAASVFPLIHRTIKAGLTDQTYPVRLPSAAGGGSAATSNAPESSSGRTTQAPPAAPSSSQGAARTAVLEKFGGTVNAALDAHEALTGNRPRFPDLTTEQLTALLADTVKAPEKAAK